MDLTGTFCSYITIPNKDPVATVILSCEVGGRRNPPIVTNPRTKHGNAISTIWCKAFLLKVKDIMTFG